MQEAIRDIQQRLLAGSFRNEAAISQGIVRRLLGRLGWPEYDPAVVWPEYSVQGTRVDFALCHPPAKPIVFVEVKQPGETGTAEQQLFQYAFHAGVPLVILTTGQEWHFYLPAKRGDYGERRVYGLDLVQRDVEESELRLRRYLEYSLVQSGVALANAEHDYEDVARTRQVRQTIPEAWQALLAEPDSLLIELIAEKTESICGYKPNPSLVGDFLRRLPGAGTVAARPSTPRIHAAVPARSEQAHPTPVPSASVSQHAPFGRRTRVGGITSIKSVTIYGDTTATRNNRIAIQHVLQVLSKRDSGFLARFMDRQGDGRQFIAQDPQSIHPNRSDYLKYVWEIAPNSGWWMNVNLSTSDSIRFIEIACEVAGIVYGQDVRLSVERT